jgi:hypothetical protein
MIFFPHRLKLSNKDTYGKIKTFLYFLSFDELYCVHLIDSNNERQVETPRTEKYYPYHKTKFYSCC